MNILSDTRGEFTFLLPDYTEITFDDWNDIPAGFKFSHIIKFKPHIPPPPHTVNQHIEMGEWNDRLQQLIEIERKNS